MRLLISTMALLLIAAPAAPAAAQTASDASDVRCLLMLQAISRDPKQAEQAAKGVYFYLGRLAARGPISRIEPLMKAEAPKLSPTQAKTELSRCGGELTNRSRELQTVNQRLAASVRPTPTAAPKK